MADSDDSSTKEQTTLETFFYLLGNFTYDKAKEFVEKERETNYKNQVNSFFSNVLSSFAQLAVAEKNYTSCTFFGAKGFLRKDNSLKSTFETLRYEFQRLEEKSTNTGTPISSPTISPSPPSLTSSPSSTPVPSPSILSATPGSVTTITTSSSVSGLLWSQYGTGTTFQGLDVMERLAGHICGQLSHFACARLETIDLYEKLYAGSFQRFMKMEDFVNLLADIISRYQRHFHHPLLSPLKTSFSFECEILLQLLEANINLQHWRFLPSMLRLYEAQSKLAVWAAPTNSRDSKKVLSNTVVQRSPAITPLYQWLCRLKAALISKFTLYFHEVLSRQTTAQDMKNICTKASVDYFYRMISFQRKTDASYVALILDTHGLEDYRGHGYNYPDKYFEPPEGLESYPAIVSCPQEKFPRWPSVIMMLTNKNNELKSFDNVIDFYDPHVQTTYFLCQVEPRITLLVIFGSRKSQRDSHIISFMIDLSSQLRCNKVFSGLKPGSK